MLRPLFFDYVARIESALRDAEHEGYNLRDDMGFFDHRKINDKIDLASWAFNLGSKPYNAMTINYEIWHLAEKAFFDSLKYVNSYED